MKNHLFYMSKCELSFPQCWRRSVQCKNSIIQRSAVQQQRKRCHATVMKPHSYRSYCIDLSQKSFPLKNFSSTSKSQAKNKILIRVIKPHEREQVLEFLRLYYYREEPLTAGSEPKQQDKEDEDANMSHLDKGTSLMALQINNTNSQETIVGAIVSSPKGPEEAAYLFLEAARYGPTKTGHILQFLACVERDANVFERFKVKHVLHVQALGVNSDLRGRRIGERLVRALLNKAKRLKYEMVTADCTSVYSARLFERMNFECIHIKYYKDYLDATGKQVFKPGAPHDCVKTFAFHLKTI